MNHPFNTVFAAPASPQSQPTGRLCAFWTLDARTGRPVQAWGMEGGPRAHRPRPALRLVKG